MYQIVFRLITSRDSMLTILLPSLLYLVVYHYADLRWAVAAASVYGVVMTFLRRDLGLISLAFALSGLIELFIIAIVPRGLIAEAVLFKIALGSLSTAVVFIVFSLLKQPIPMLIAEVSTPSLKESRETMNVPSLTTWQQVSSIWIVSNLVKCIFLLSRDSVSERDLAAYTVILGWPLYVVLIVISVWLVSQSYKNAHRSE
ncbi:DUF3159 domain-containing protein [Photobacterium galatheae]|uniref:Intracellular septation protein A n=1 Tax=Photobacterium galatheae TaxID=1654360 RepID=A0A066RWH7_9GAMM|nr:DUF3159 domain-containing protein [Photobacterium galatheae]KDM93471.1 hypothetical protein EA58_00980 [Photobacterium galatheae]MCM0147051.1 DUF3159 domain-containing protein [Photobacterium galatheae]